jgi:replicative DNA helicase
MEDSNLLETAAQPANVEAERSILGGILLENAVFYECSDLGHCFYLDSHRRIFSRMAELVKDGRPVDIVTLAEILIKRKEIEAVGGVAYLASLTEGLPRRPSIREYVDIVRGKWISRQAINIFNDGVNRVSDESEEIADLIADIDRQLLDIACGAAEEPSLKGQTDSAFQELADQREGKTETAVSTGLTYLDRIIGGGYKKRRLYVVGGRPSMGKTSAMIQATIQHCFRGIRTRLISLEMSAEELIHRIWAAVSGISYELVIDPAKLTAYDWGQIEIARSLVAGWPLEIDDRGGQTIDFALAGCRMSCRRRGTGFVAMDYLQNLRFVGPAKLRYQEISDAAAKCRAFAKEEDVPFLMLSSITESNEKNPNKRPVLADLRGSGDLSFHADVAVLIHRERGEDGASIDTHSEMVVAKQRGGRTGVAYATYNTNSLLFEDSRTDQHPHTGQ